MKCPRCGLIVTDQVPQCRGCGFSIGDLERTLMKQPSGTPARAGFVSDFASLLTKEEKSHLEERLKQFNETHNGEIVLVTMPTTKPVKPSAYAFWLFNRWQVGGPQHTGLMILLAQAEQRIECEVGYSWEPIISEVESGQILDETVVPLLQAGKIGEALQAGIARLASFIEEAATPIEEPVTKEETRP